MLPHPTWARPVNGLSGCTTSVLPGVRRSSGPCITTTNLGQQEGLGEGEVSVRKDGSVDQIRVLAAQPPSRAHATSQSVSC